MKSKYKIDIRLQSEWQKFGLDPDEIEWISSESFFSTAERESVWKAVEEVLNEYDRVLRTDLAIKSSRYRVQYDRGRPVNDSQAKIINNPAQVRRDMVDSFRKKLKGAIGI